MGVVAAVPVVPALLTLRTTQVVVLTVSVKVPLRGTVTARGIVPDAVVGFVGGGWTGRDSEPWVPAEKPDPGLVRTAVRGILVVTVSVGAVNDDSTAVLVAPPESCAVPTELPLFSNVTVPVAFATLAVAVRMVVCPLVAGFGLAVSVRLTDCAGPTNAWLAVNEPSALTVTNVLFTYVPPTL